MNSKKLSQWMFVLIVTILLLAGCGGDISVATPTNTEVVVTNTEIPPTATNTSIPPTETRVPIVFLQGKINFSGARQDPFSTKLAIHATDEFKTAWTTQSDKNGEYYFADIKPGKYNLWILMTANNTMISGCSDVTSPGKTWKTGIYLSETTALTVDKNLSLLVAMNLKGFAGVSRIDFISPEIELESGKVTELSIELNCKLFIR